VNTATAPERHVGPLALTLGADEAAALSAALGSQRPGWVPVIFPARWLALPEIRAAVAELVDLENGLPLHETQGFDVVAPLQAGTAYTLIAAIRRLDDNPPRLSIQGRVTGPDGTDHARFQAGLRVVPRKTPP